MDMVDNVYVENLALLVKEKKLSVASIDEAVRRILRLKFRLGLFDSPYVTELPEVARYFQPESMAIAANLAEESMVLLKNNQVLPLNNSIKKIALIGPMVMDSVNIMGSWEGQGFPESAETIMEGFEKEFKGKVDINYAKGCGFDGTDESGFTAALELAQQADVVIVCIGEMKKWSGENASRSTIALPSIQEKLVNAIARSGKKIILIVSSGRPVELSRLEPVAEAIMEIWQPGIAGGSPLAGLISGRLNPSGKLAITFPYSTGQLPVYYNMRESARPKLGGYQDIPTAPLYWFGHGLSYTTFAYGPIRLSDTVLNKKGKITVEVEVENTGSRKGKEIVFGFIADPVASVTRPVRELKYFEKIELNAGETKTVRFEIVPARDLSFPDMNGLRRLESGDFFLMIDKQKLKFSLMD
jgi:beta-glucosidase